MEYTEIAARLHASAEVPARKIVELAN